MYVDSNIFVLAILNSGVKGDKARTFIREVRTNQRDAATSSLTYDEVVWAIMKEQGREFALNAGKVFLNMRNLVLLDVNRERIRDTQEFMQKYSMDPRDAIHAATAISNNQVEILSEDRVFDKVPELKRVSLSQL